MDSPSDLAVAEAVLDRLFGIADWYSQVNMLWWVSSTALIGALLAGAWVKRDELTAESVWRTRLFRTGFVFLASVVAYGAIATFGAFRLAQRGIEACEAVGATVCSVGGEDVIFRIMPWAIVVGTSSFAIALFAWILVFARDNGASQNPTASES